MLMDAIESYCKDTLIASSDDLNEKAYWFLNELTSYPICQCKGCSRNVSFRSLRKGYASVCCSKHAAIVSRDKVALTNIERYGSPTPLQNKEIREKINQHNLETYGTINIVESKYFKKKRVETC